MKKILAAASLAVVAACAETSTPADKPETQSAATPAPPAAAPAEVSVTSKVPAARDAFLAARERLELFDVTAGEASLKKALELDPDFALAHAVNVRFVAGKEAVDEAAKARSLMGAVPEAEQLLITTMIAGVEGKEAEVLAAEKKLAELMPTDWRVQQMQLDRAFNEQRFDDAVRFGKRATELNPKAGISWNMLGYTYMQQKKTDEAVAAFQKYTEVAPTDPNALDSLGDSLIRAGKLEDAEASFNKALAVDAKYAVAHTGIALSRALRGNWPGALEAMQKYVDATPRAQDKPGAMVDLAWWQLAAGKPADADKTMTAAEKAATELKRDSFLVFLPVQRAEMMNVQGKSKDVAKLLDEAQKRSTTAVLTGGAQINFKAATLAHRLRAQAALGAKADAVKTGAELEALIKTLPDSPSIQSWLHDTRGDVARASGDLKTAVAEYAQCNSDALTCLGYGVVTAEKAGDKAAADAMRAKIAENASRDRQVVVARSQAKMFAAK